MNGQPNVGDFVDSDGWETTRLMNFADFGNSDVLAQNLRTRQIWGRETITNNEQQYYDDRRETGIDPFEFHSDRMDIVARPLDVTERLKRKGQKYSSGLISSHRSDFLLEGEGQISFLMRVPTDKGLWPAAWLYPEFDEWPEGINILPEVDVMEAVGHGPDEYFCNQHTYVDGKNGQRVQCLERIFTGAILSGDFHRYGVRRTANQMSYFFDDRFVKTVPLPADLAGPLHFMVNLAVGGGWPGSPPETTGFPARLGIREVRIEKHPDHKAETLPDIDLDDEQDVTVSQACDQMFERLRQEFYATADEVIQREMERQGKQ